MAIPLHNISVAFQELGRQVEIALRTQLGDAARLAEHKRRCMEFMREVHAHVDLLQPNDYRTIESSVERMISALDEATITSSDFPDAPPQPFGGLVHDGNPGHPRIDITLEDLQRLSNGRTTHQQIADIYQCSARTIRRRLIEYGLSSPGPPMYIQEEQPDGSFNKVYTPGVSADLSQITDEDLDRLMLDIYDQFPSFGRRMIDGYLLHLGERVPRQRILDSYRRVVGPTTSSFGARRIQRRVYSVPGPNSLWHHDGQHGLIRWKIVIHAFIDGFSRLLLGIRASNNNRAETVLSLFEDIVAVFGYPSRIRGDHGTENLMVAAKMERARGENRGSYIWGRSVHNIRIERLWVDVTSGFGGKWKNFFRLLEVHDGLDVNLDSHIWLLHYLFLASINNDAETWADTWNHHTLARRGETHRSPHNMFLHGTIENGHRGLQTDDSMDGNDYDAFGIDWDDMDNANMRRHHDEFNTDDGDPSNPFLTNQPDHLSHIEVLDARCPFSPEQISIFEDQLTALPLPAHHDMVSRRSHWIQALEIATNLLSH